MPLIAHYRLDGNAADAVSLTTGTVNNSPSMVPGKIGEATDMSTGSFEWPCEIRETYSMAFWIKVKVGFTGNFRKFLTKGTDRSPGFWLYSSGNRLHLQQRTTDGTNEANSGADTITPYTVGEWQHITFVVDASAAGTEIKTYVNGALDRTGGHPTYKPQVEGETITFNQQDVVLDDFRIYDHALSEKEISEISKGLAFDLECTAEGPSDRSTQLIEVINNNVEFVDEPNPIGDGAYLFGITTGNRVRIEDNFTYLEDFTMSAWVNPAGDHKNYDGAILSSGSWNQIHWAFSLKKGNTGISTRSPSTFTSYTFPLNEWSHVTWSRKGDQIKVYVNGVLIATHTNSTATPLGSGYSYTNVGGDTYTNPTYFAFNGKIAGAKIFATALSDDDVMKLYQERAWLDSKGNLGGVISEDKLKPLILDYTTWQAGTIGSASGFSRNGNNEENHRVLGLDPWGRETVLWEAQPDDVSGADGGFVSGTFPVDSTKMYRFVSWVKRNSNSNGRYYLGTYGYNPNNGILGRSNGTVYTNPYFWSNITTFIPDEWHCVVGHIWPEGSGVGSSHPDSGVYDSQGNRIANISQDFVWQTGTTLSRYRTYLYYGTDTTQRQWWCYPRVDELNGTEPTLQDIFAGYDSKSINFRRLKGGDYASTFDVSPIVRTGDISEVGITRGLSSYFPFNDTYEDVMGNGTVNSIGTARAVDEFVYENGFLGANFTGVANDDVRFDIADPVDEDGNWTISFCVLNRRFDSLNSYPIFLTFYSYPYFAVSSAGTSMRMSYSAEGSQQQFYSSGSMAVGEWVVFTVSLDADNGVMKMYRNGELIATKTGIIDLASGTLNSFNIGNYTGANYFTDGVLRDLRIYGVTLTDEEIGIQAKLDLNTSKLEIANGAVYTKGQIKEV